MKRNTSVREQFELQEASLNSASQTVQKQMFTRKLLRGALYVSAFGLVPIAAFSAIANYVEATAPDTTPTISSEEVNHSVGKQAAHAELTAWLHTDPAPLPGGEIVSWDGYVSRDAPEPFDEHTPTPAHREEVHRFTVRAGEQVFDVHVMVLVDDLGGVQDIGTPSLMPVLVTPGNFGAAAPWFGYQSANPTEAVATAVDVWATAFTSGSPKLLKQAVGEKQDDRSYLPLTGVAGVNATITATGVKAPTSKAEAENWEAPNWVIARVQLHLQWAGHPLTEGGQKPAPATFDVLIIDTDTATPRVVSWGGSGTGPTLEPYSVGITGVALREPSTTNQTQTGE